MQRMHAAFIGIILCGRAMGAQCPAGFVAVPDNTLITGDTCPAGYVSVDTWSPCPSNGPCLLTCPFGTQLRTGPGTYVNINPNPETTPSLRISYDNTVCFVSLQSGPGANAINIRYNDRTYHTVN
ncbi:MAG: hypothetical protein K2L94_04250 [Alphaproteobacteria bacterium]|nr:hypothetical protein [Alphaproteobacteria bacterium]